MNNNFLGGGPISVLNIGLFRKVSSEVVVTIWSFVGIPAADKVFNRGSILSGSEKFVYSNLDVANGVRMPTF